MKIGIYDDKFFSLQERLIIEGHDLFVFVGNHDIPADKFNLTSVSGPGTLTQARTFIDLIDEDCDFYITGTDQDDQAFDILKSLGHLVIGYSESVCELEYNRDYAQRVLLMLDVDSLGLKLPVQHSFTSPKQVEEFLLGERKSWVIKKANGLESQDNRTVVSHFPHTQVCSILIGNRAWFNEEGYGGVVVEQFIQGNEVCFGRWFNGTKFVGPLYACEEHKGAQNGDRGRILTGEVGGWLQHYEKPKGLMVEVFERLEDILKNKCCGLVDINTIINSEGVYFLEFTMRFGRPTLEYLVGSMKPKTHFAEFLSQLASGQSPSYNAHKVVAGVTVFSYGIPLSSSNIPCILFNPPYCNLQKASVQQLFCTVEDGLWKTAVDERQFTVVGFDKNASRACANAYEPLENFSLLGCTWRDDVGLRYNDIQALLSKHKVLKK